MDKPKPPRPALMVHAGAWDIPAEEREPHARACRAALDAGWAVLHRGGSALDAVETAIVALEDDPAVNAGTGSVLTRDGEVELDAGLMCGLTLDAGAVIGQRTVKNPIRLARAVLGSDYVLLGGKAAEEVVRAKGLATCPPGAFVTERERARLEAWKARGGASNPGADFGHKSRAPTEPGDTVGAVAVDGIGRIAAGLSTGGMCGKPSGRIGDAPIPNCGFFADDRLAGVACTGWGEGILRMGLARRTAELARDNSAQDAAWLGIRELQDRIDGRAGVIVIARNGSIGWAFNTPFMALGYRDTETDVPVIRGLGDSV